MKTFQECKEEIAKKYDYPFWSYFEQAKYYETESYEQEAAELFAEQNRNAVFTEYQKFREGFEKWHVRGLPFHIAFHVISKPDFGLVHDHLTDIRIMILQGSYWERVYTVNEDMSWSYEDFHRKAGEVRDIKATCIHEILSLPDGPCYTQIMPGPIVHEWGFWNFDARKATFTKFEP